MEVDEEAGSEEAGPGKSSPWEAGPGKAALDEAGASEAGVGEELDGADGGPRRTGRKRKAIDRWEPPPAQSGRACRQRCRSEDVDIMRVSRASEDQATGSAVAGCADDGDTDDDVEPCAS